MNDARNPELKPIVRAGIARAFCELEECKRKLKMRPLPKPIDVTQPLKRVKAIPEVFLEADPKGISLGGEG